MEDNDQDTKPTVIQTGPYRWSAHSTPRLDSAMAAAQGEMGNAYENRKNSHLKSSYADLGSIFNAIREACSKHGIARYQTPWTDNGGLCITTRIAHDGEWVEADFGVNIEEMKGVKRVQMAGSAMTYVKRYAIASMFGTTSGDDDDGESSGPGNGGDNRGPSPAQSQWNTATDAFSKLGVKPGQLLTWLKRKNFDQVTDQDHELMRGLYGRLDSGKSTMDQELDG